MKSENIEVKTEFSGHLRPAGQNQKPLVLITPQKKWYDLDWKEIWYRRDLLKLLVLKVIRLRYRQTFLGVLWTVFQPIIPMLVFSLVFRSYFNSPNQQMSYSLFVYSGLILWLYFSNAVSHSGNSLASQSHLLGKIYFPRFMLPLSVVIAGGLDFSVGCLLLLGFVFISGGDLHWQLILIPLLFLMTAALALAIGTIFASLSIIYRDIRNILPYLLQLGLFLTPIAYPLDNIPARWHWLFIANPLTGIVNAFRHLLFGEFPDWSALLISLLITIGLLAFSIMIFVRMEKYTADYL